MAGNPIIETEVDNKRLYVEKTMDSNNYQNNKHTQISLWTKASDITMSNGEDLQEIFDAISSDAQEYHSLIETLKECNIDISEYSSVEEIIDTVSNLQSPIISALEEVCGVRLTDKSVQGIETYLDTRYSQLVNAVTALGITLPSGATYSQIAERLNAYNNS